MPSIDGTLPQVSGSAVPAPPAATPLAPQVDGTGAASASQQAPPAPKDSFAPRRFAPATPNAAPGLPEMLRLVATQPFHTVQNLANSHYIPSAINFFYIVAMMDQQMVNTHKFTQSNPNWHPLVSQLFFALMFYIHIIRCMVESDPTNIELVQFYDILYRHLGLDSFVIPGPLVPFFQAITYASSPFEWIGNIAPTLPMTTGASARNHFLLGNNMYFTLPSIPFIIDQIHELATSTQSEAHYNLHWNHVENIFNVQAGNTSVHQRNMVTPNARWQTFVPYAAANTFCGRIASLSLPSRLTGDTTAGNNVEMNWLQFFGFQPYDTQTTSHNWTTTIGPIMSVYSTFFKDSCSLLSISPTGLGASLPVALYKAASTVLPTASAYVAAVTAAAGPPAVAAAPSHFKRLVPHNSVVDLHHGAHSLSELAEQYAALSLVNCSFTGLTTTLSIGCPTDAHLRTGHYWTLPNVREAKDVNTAPGVPNNIASYYHSAVPVRK